MQLLSVSDCQAETGQHEYCSLLPHRIWQEVIFLESSYCVTVGGNHAGKVLVRRQGLYYHFSCRCRLHCDTIYRLVVSCGNHRENLGILVPDGDGFILQTKLPVKKLGEGDLSFTLVAKQESVAGTFVPIHPEEPFAYIARLKESFLILRNGQPGIYIKKMQEC